MRRRLAVGATALLVLAPACGDDGSQAAPSTTTATSTTSSTAATTTSTSTPTSTTAAPPVAPRVAAAVLERGSDTSPTSVSIRYPRLGGMSDAAAEATANRAIEALVNAEAERFETQARDIAGSGGPGAGGEQLSADGDFEQVRVDPRIASFRMTVSEYLGGAHPVEIVLTANVDVASGRLLGLEELFRPGSDWAAVVSTESRRLLREKLGRDYVAEQVAAGTTPDPKNFAAFAVADGALEVTFQDYQVAAYAAGTPTISIPAAALAPVLGAGSAIS